MKGRAIRGGPREAGQRCSYDLEDGSRCEGNKAACLRLMATDDDCSTLPVDLSLGRTKGSKDPFDRAVRSDEALSHGPTVDEGQRRCRRPRHASRSMGDLVYLWARPRLLFPPPLVFAGLPPAARFPPLDPEPPPSSRTSASPPPAAAVPSPSCPAPPPPAGCSKLRRTISASTSGRPSNSLRRIAS